MARVSMMGSPYLLGFDQIERTLDQISKSANDGFPPYNIEQLSETRLRITLALAGFHRRDLAVTLEDSKLVIRGRAPETPEREFLHRGIATRQFQRSFVLADGMEVSGATLKDGLLSIDLARPQAQTTIQEIEITVGGRREDAADAA